MSDIKNFSDYEKMFIEKNKDMTVGELVDACPAPSAYLNKPPYTHRDTHYASIHSSHLNALSFKLRRDFYDFALKEEGFLNIPILGSVYDEDADSSAYIVEKMFDVERLSMYKCLSFDCFDGCFVTTGCCIPTNDFEEVVFPCPETTIRDLYLEVKEYFEDRFNRR